MTITMSKSPLWKDIPEKYPHAFELFKEWIDHYKENVGWRYLFVSKVFETKRPEAHEDPFFNVGMAERQQRYDEGLVKFHQLPEEMQVGVFCRFAMEMNRTYEYHYWPYDVLHDKFCDELHAVFTNLEHKLSRLTKI